MIWVPPSWAGESKVPPQLEQAASKSGLAVQNAMPLHAAKAAGNIWVGACKKEAAMQLCIFDENNNSFSLKKPLVPLQGDRLHKLQIMELVSLLPGPEILLELYSENPDEKIKRLRVYTLHPEPREIFLSVIYYPKDIAKRETWERAKHIVKYGNPKPGWSFEGVGENPEAKSNKEIVIRKKPQVLQIPRENQDPIMLITGIRESIYAYQGDDKSGRFEASIQNRFVEFLPSKPPKEIRASGSFVPPKILRKMESEQLAAALVAATEGDEEHSELKELDFSPYTLVVSDNDTNSAWIENDADGPGFGEWIEFSFEKPTEINMIRMVPGCTKSKNAFQAHNIPTKVELRFSDSSRAFVDLTRPEQPRSPVIAMKNIALRGKPFAIQHLLFFEGKSKAKSVRVILNEVKQQGGTNRTCISEFSIH